MVAGVSMILRAVTLSPVRRSLGSTSVTLPAGVVPVPPDVPVEEPNAEQVPAPLPAAPAFAPDAALALASSVVATHPMSNPAEVVVMSIPAVSASEEQLAAARQEGYDEGQREALVEAQRQWSEQDARINALGASFALARQTVVAQAEDGLVALAFEAVCTILGSTVTTREAVQSVVRQLLAALPEASNARVLLHPADAALFEQAIVDAPDLLAATLTIVPDATLALGGCVVEAPGATLAARLDWQLDQLRTLLLTVRSARQGTI